MSITTLRLLELYKLIRACVDDSDRTVYRVVCVEKKGNSLDFKKVHTPPTTTAAVQAKVWAEKKLYLIRLWQRDALLEKKHSLFGMRVL